MIRKPSVVPPVRSPLQKHWQGTEGAHDVMTLPVLQAMATAGDTIREHGVCAFDGPPGLSKTFAAKSVAERLKIDWHYEEAALTQGLRRIYQRHLEHMGKLFDPRWRASDAEDAFLEAICEKEGVLIIDEVHREGHIGMEVVRFGITQPSNRTSFILIGHKLDALFAANPALDSRARREHFRPLSDQECREALRQYDDVFVDAPDSVLDPIVLFSSGYFRQMAQVLQEIRRLKTDRRKLSATLVKEAIEATRRERRPRAA
jgi:replication-associated recombination protein RarA